MRAIIFFLALSAAAQPPTFTAADVHPSPAGASQSGAFLPNGRVEFRATTLLRLISIAYSVPADRIAGGPAWLDTDPFDVTAQGPARANQLALRTMLQPLLADRFGLVVERQEKSVPAFVLTLARPGLLKPHEPNGAPDCKRTQDGPEMTMACRNMTISSFAERVQLQAAGYFNLPVVDRTGLAGAYDFTLRYVGRGRVSAETDSTSLFTVIEKQTGIHVERASAPLPVVAIVKVNRTPAPNPPGTDAKLGPAPTEFEVADIRPSRPGAQEDVNFANGRIDARAILLRDLIAFAYNVEENWVRGEKWLESDRFDIKAKSALTESDDTFRVMVQNLLAERFHLEVHKETQPVDVYALTAPKPKLKPADPAARSTCKSGMSEGMRYLACTNTAMPQLAARLRDVSQGYIDRPVVDLTGLTTAYDFTLSWTPFAHMTRHGSDDNAVLLTLSEAIDRQLGLKLATRKHPMPIVIVDHCDRTPTEN